MFRIFPRFFYNKQKIDYTVETHNVLEKSRIVFFFRLGNKIFMEIFPFFSVLNTLTTVCMLCKKCNDPHASYFANKQTEQENYFL